MCIRQPQLAEREHPDLHAEAEQQQAIDQGAQAGAGAAETLGECVQRCAEPGVRDQRHGRNDGHPGQFHQQQILVGTAGDGLVVVIEADQEKGGHGHHLPGDGETDAEIIHRDDADHACNEDRKIEQEGAQSVVAVVLHLHVADAVESRQGGHQGDEPEKDRREAVDQEGDGEPAQSQDEGFGRCATAQHLNADQCEDDTGGQTEGEIERTCELAAAGEERGDERRGQEQQEPGK